MKALKTWKLGLPGLLLTLALQLTLGTTGAWAAGPLENVKGLIDEVQCILQTNLQKSKRLELIEKITDRHLDFREMAKRCLDSTWNTLTRAQQEEFVKLFSRLLKASYAGHLDEFAKTKVDYLGETNKAECGEVRILVIRANDKIPVNFRLLKEARGWMIYDMEIEGVSMVCNLQTQFCQTIKESSYHGLVRCMKVKLLADRS